MTRATVKPSKSQEAAIKYFAGFAVPVDVRVTQRTYEVCREHGWIESIDEFPFHRVTSLGRAAVGLPVHGERHGTCGTCHGGVHEYPAGWAHTVRQLNCSQLIPTNVR